MTLRQTVGAFGLAVWIAFMLLAVPSSWQVLFQALKQLESKKPVRYTTLVILPRETNPVDVHYPHALAVGDLINLPNLRSERLEVIAIEHKVIDLGYPSEVHQRTIHVAEVCEPGSAGSAPAIAPGSAGILPAPSETSLSKVR